MDTNGFNESRTSISCENIPELFLDKLVAKTHFSQFGKIKRFILRPNRLACTVEYEHPDAAQLALEKGSQYKNVAFNIGWTDLKPTSNADVGKPGGFLDAEVQMELEAIDNSFLSLYKSPEQRSAAVTNNRPTLAKPTIPNSSRTEMGTKTGQARTELETLARKPTTTAEERYRVLEAKDRYIRLTTERTTDIRKAKNIEGTCPDMCPEKERYLREWKCMVPSYERQLGASGTNQIDHVKAIKQYSRSSADQELPLPHELRSQLALGRTMHFLLTHLADLCDSNESEGGGNVSDWFHYIWDRTRGIRKDITQQDLCSPAVVELVEQCTRFHIHCAARLVSEDPSVFDQKINTENMTKCLQTLKYMYTDLAQRNQCCPAEAEFRAYMVLLYLNDGNFLWELRQLPATIIHSREIQFALSVYFALEENNFVRFFQLVRMTSYMNACILLRYFTQVRQKALEVLRKAYAVRATANFSLAYLTRILGFENEYEAEAFFDHYGISIHRATSMVQFEPKQFYQPEFPFTTNRAIQLVESKRTTSVGEIICGRPLVQWGRTFPTDRPPHDSFDARGCLKDQVLQGILKGHTDTDHPDLLRNQDGLLKGIPVDLMEEDNVDSMEKSARNENPPSDDRLLFKVPSPTITVPRLSPRSHTPPVKAPVGTLAEPNSATISPVVETLFSFGSPAPSIPTTGNDLPATVKPPPTFAFGDKSLSSFSTPNASTNLFGSITYSLTKCDPVDRGDSVTMQYPSPPTNQSITSPGQKRTFFGAAKDTSSSMNIIQKTASVTPETGSLFLPTTVGMSSLPSGSSLFGSVAGFVKTIPPEKRPTNAIPTDSDTLSLGGLPGSTANDVAKNDDKHSLRSILKRPISPDHARKEREKLEYQEKKREQKKREKENRRTIERSSAIQLEKLLDSVVENAVLNIAESALAQHNHMKRYPAELFNELVNELLADTVNTAARQEITRLERLKSHRVRQLSKKYFHRWHRNAQSAIRWRSLMRTVPSSFVSGGVRMDELPDCNQLPALLNYQHARMQRKAEEVLQDRSVRREIFLFDDFPEQELIDPFPVLEKAVSTPMTESRPVRSLIEPLYWKLSISVPIESEENSVGFPSFVDRWLHRCAFRKDERCSRFYFFKSTRQPMSRVQNSMQQAQGDRAICMRLVRGKNATGEKDTDSEQACSQINGLLFFLNDRCNVGKARERLQSVLAKSNGSTPSVAVVLYRSNSIGVGKGTVSFDSVGKDLGLDDGTVKRWRVFSWTKATENHTLRGALTFLANSHIAQLRFDQPRYAIRLEMRPMTDFIERCFGSELWYRFDKSGLLIGQSANTIVELYNLALGRVSRLVTQDLARFKHHAKEFDNLQSVSLATTPRNYVSLPEAFFPPNWNSSDRQQRIGHLLDAMTLYPLPNQLLAAIDRAAQAATQQSMALDVKELKLEVLKYAIRYRVLQDDSHRELNMLVEKFVQGIVAQVSGYAFEKETQSLQGTGHCRQCYWVPLLSLVSETILRVSLAIFTRKPNLMLPYEICYPREGFLRLTEEDWWSEHLKAVQQRLGTAKPSQSKPLKPHQKTNLPNLANFYIELKADRKRAHSQIMNIDERDNETAPDGEMRNGSDRGNTSNSTECNEISDGNEISQRSNIKRAKLYNDIDFDDVIEKGMKALVRAEQLLDLKYTIANQLQEVFDPLERKILKVEDSCRVIKKLHGASSAP